MKKAILISLAFITAVILTEGVVRYCLHYPLYGVDKKVSGLTNNPNVFLPYSEFWDVEGGNHVYHRNNLGVSGKDVKVSDQYKNIFILGTSFVEAYQYPPDSIASSLFQDELQQQHLPYQVVNLGSSGHNAYDSYFRLKYYESLLKPHYVILIVDGLPPSFYPKTRNIQFSLGKDFGQAVHSKFNAANIWIRNHSALINLMAKAAMKENRQPSASSSTGDPEITELPDLLTKSLDQYQKEYGNAFMCLSISADTALNARLSSYCRQGLIRYEERIINIPSEKIEGKGHLNQSGNRKLAKFLYDAFTQNFIH